MKDLLVGSTGFVGGNLQQSHHFDAQCHSTNVSEYYGSAPDLCVYAGIPSAMYLANKNPDADLDIMRQALINLRRIAPRQTVLISTIAVYADSRRKTENDAELTPRLAPYGYNRLLLEQWVQKELPNVLIVRLPALYGKGLKKNFLFDLHTMTPAMLQPEKYETLARLSPLIKAGYTPDPTSGFYKLNGTVDAQELKNWYKEHSFNALSFTDSRSKYQFYNLARLWDDISLALDANINCLNLTPPPVSAAEVYREITGRQDWSNELSTPPFDYDLRSVHAELLGGNSDGYLCAKQEELAEIKNFMNNWQK